MSTPRSKGALSGLSLEKPKVKVRKGPLWAGPESPEPNGGITFSLLCRFLSCRERFRLTVVEGLKATEQFNHRIEYGNMWHVCEEFHAEGQAWEGPLRDYAQELCKKYPLKQEEIEHWYCVCAVQFPVYVDYWAKHPDVENRKPLFQEQVFHVPYKLPGSGRTVYLRGKWDSTDFVTDKRVGIWSQENKTKGEIDIEQIRRQLTFDLQTMMYTIALEEGLCPTCRGMWTPEKAKFLDESPELCPNCSGKPLEPFVRNRDWSPPKGFPTTPIKGVRYNIVRRPLSGGEGTIVQKKGSKNVPAETKDQYYERVRGVIDGTGVNSKGENYAGPSHFFIRWNTEITPTDIQRFKEQCFNELLEALCNWWAYITGQPVTGHLQDCLIGFGQSWRHPFGVRNILDEGGSSDYDNYLETGSTVGLRKVDNLFPELQ